MKLLNYRKIKLKSTRVNKRLKQNGWNAHTLLVTFDVVPTPAAFDEMQQSRRAHHRIRCFASRVTCIQADTHQRPCANNYTGLLNSAPHLSPSPLVTLSSLLEL